MRHGRRPATDAETALWLQQNVKRVGDCRLWLGPFSGGYPSITWKQKKMMARRLVAILSGRMTFESRLRVYMSPDCDHPDMCVANDHIVVGTKLQSERAAHARGAFPSGARRALASAIGHCRPGVALPISERRNVTDMLSKGMTQAQIGKLYGVTAARVSQAIRTWRKLFPVEL